MNILIITGCIAAKNCGRNRFTGLDYVVADIVKTIGVKCNIIVYTLTPYPKSSTIDNGVIRSYSTVSLLKYININDFKKYYNIISEKNIGFKQKIKNLRSFLVSKDIESLCQRKKFDLINIHGAAYQQYINVHVAEKCHIPVLFSLHGLISFGAPNISYSDMKSERKLLELIKKNNMIITVVSSGIKKEIINHCQISNDNIYVINNAISFPDTEVMIDCYNKWKIDPNKKIILSVGTLCNIKNQIQLLRAYLLLPSNIKNKYCIILAGYDESCGEIRDFININKLNNDVIITGFITKEKLRLLYKIADFNVLLSRSEGFGISMIEAMSFGLPTLTYYDLDAVKDIFSPECMLLLKKRDDITVKEGILEIINTKWDRDKIVNLSKKYSEDSYWKYFDTYEVIIKNTRNYVTNESVYNQLGIVK